jgi:hypothetical protein
MEISRPSWQIDSLCYNDWFEPKSSAIPREDFLVSKKSNAEKLAKIKTMLAEKYERLAKITPSVPRRASMLRHAKSYRRQAELLSR